MSEVLRPTPQIVNDLPAINFDAQAYTDLLRAEGLSDNQIPSLTVHFNEDRLPNRRFGRVTIGTYSPDEAKMTISVFPESTLPLLNVSLLHETKHATNDFLGIVKRKSLKKEVVERLVIYLGVYSIALVGLGQVRLYEAGLLFAILPPVILSFLSNKVAKKYQERLTKDERLASKFAKRMMKDPKFNSLVTLKK